MNLLESRIEFHRWLDRCIQDGRDKLGLDSADFIVLFAEELKQLVVCEYAERIRK